MRPQIELIREVDYILRPAELPSMKGPVITGIQGRFEKTDSSDGQGR